MLNERLSRTLELSFTVLSLITLSSFYPELEDMISDQIMTEKIS